MIFDFHNDILTAQGDYLALANSIGLFDNIAVHAIWTTELINPLDYIMQCVKRFGKNKILAIEDLGFIKSFDDLSSFDFSPFAYCSLTWNYDNLLCSGAYGTDNSLTPLGIAAIKKMNRQGCALDLSHINQNCFFSALDESVKTVISHTALVSDKVSADKLPRCITLDMATELSKRNGIIGLMPVTAYSCAYTAKQFALSLVELADCIGANHVAVGTDFYGSADFPCDVRRYQDIDKLGEYIIDYANYEYASAILYDNLNSYFEEKKYEQY